MDGPGAELSKLYTLALSTPLQKEHATGFPSEATWESAGRGKCLHNKKGKGGLGRQEGQCVTPAQPSFAVFYECSVAAWLLPAFPSLPVERSGVSHPQAEYMLCELSV